MDPKWKKNAHCVDLGSHRFRVWWTESPRDPIGAGVARNGHEIGPKENGMTQFHEAPRYRDAFEKALESIYC